MTDYSFSSFEDIKGFTLKDGDTITVTQDCYATPPEALDECLIASGYSREEAEEIEKAFGFPNKEERRKRKIKFDKQQKRARRWRAIEDALEVPVLILLFILIVIAWSLPEALQ